VVPSFLAAWHAVDRVAKVKRRDAGARVKAAHRSF